VTRAGRVLIALCAAAAVVWVFAPPPGATEPADETASELPDPDAAQIRVALAPPPIPPPEPRREPPRGSTSAEPPQTPAPAPQPSEPAAIVVPSSDTLRRGTALMEAGSFPRLRATYDRIGFADYRDAMLALGGRFYLFDAGKRRPVAEIEPRSGAIGGETVPARLSRWPRDVTRHLPSALENGRGRYGDRVTRVVLLPPRSLDAALLGALDARMRDAELRAPDVLGVSVAYELRGGRLHCAVLDVTLRDGRKRSLPLIVDLSRTGARS
jgi:hypothetical protein